MEQRIVVTDVETGGTDSTKHSLLQVAIVVFENGKELDAIKINVVHDEYCVTDVAMKINKIDLDKHKGLSKEDAVKEIKAFMAKYFDEPAQVCGHNVSFDVSFIKKMFNDVGENYDRLFSYRLLDTSAVARFLIFIGVIPSGGSLGDLLTYFKVPHDKMELHDALVDCRVTYQLLLAMRSLFPEKVEV